MPIGAGILNSLRYSYYTTSINIVNITPPTGSADCGDLIEFFVQVESTSSYAVNSGTFDIIDLNTDTIIGSGSIFAGIGSTGLVSGLSGLLNIAAIYNGVSGTYAPSTSLSQVYSISKQRVTVSIDDPPDNSYYCYYNPLNITASVSGVSSGTPSGTVNFRLYTDASNYLELPSGNLVSGSVTIEMPAETGSIAIEERYIQAIYNGDSCYFGGITSGGYSGLQINAITEDSTSILIDDMSSGSYLITDPITFTATVTANNIVSPDGYDGYVKFEYTSPIGGPSTELGISYMEEGVSSLTVPGNTFSSTGSWIVSSSFHTESSCYASTLYDSSTTITVY